MTCLNGARILVTGGSGGIGRELARTLVTHGAHVLLTGRSAEALEETRTLLIGAGYPGSVATFVADLTRESDRDLLCERARTWKGGIDTLINNAGSSQFSLLEDLSRSELNQLLAINVIAPIDLCRRLLPHLRTRSAAHIVNIGSVLGAIGYPGYSVYCASKHALRGFTEALLRELAGTSVHVHYYAPRATGTAFNPAHVDAMNKELGTATDTPVQVAERITALLLAGRERATLGFPEWLYVKLNALVPRLVDASIARQLPIIRRHAIRSDEPSSDLQPRTSVSS